MNACVLGYRVRYRTSGDMLAELTAALADQTLPRLLREYARLDLLIVDEFGFDQIERSESRQAASLLYKLIDMRSPKRSTAMVTNIDFEAWEKYLGDPPLAMAFLDRIVDGAIILKINGKSYRAHRAKPVSPGKEESIRRAFSDAQGPLKPSPEGEAINRPSMRQSAPAGAGRKVPSRPGCGCFAPP